MSEYFQCISSSEILLTYVMRKYKVLDDIWSSLVSQKYNPNDQEIYQTMGKIIRMSGNIDLGGIFAF